MSTDHQVPTNRILQDCNQVAVERTLSVSGKRKRLSDVYELVQQGFDENLNENWVGEEDDFSRSDPTRDNLLLLSLSCFTTALNVNSVCLSLRKWQVRDGTDGDERVIPEFRGKSSATLHEFINGLTQLYRYLKADPNILILSIGYIHRLHRAGYSLNSITLFRALLASTLMAIKFYDDDSITNRFFASLVGLQVHDVNRLEVALLSALQWRLHLSVEELVCVDRELNPCSIMEL